MGKVEAAERTKSSCEPKGELPGTSESPNVDSAEELVTTEADAALSTSDKQVKVSFSQVICGSGKRGYAFPSISRMATNRDASDVIIFNTLMVQYCAIFT